MLNFAPRSRDTSPHGRDALTRAKDAKGARGGRGIRALAGGRADLGRSDG